MRGRISGETRLQTRRLGSAKALDLVAIGDAWRRRLGPGGGPTCQRHGKGAGILERRAVPRGISRRPFRPQIPALKLDDAAEASISACSRMRRSFGGVGGVHADFEGGVPADLRGRVINIIPLFAVVSGLGGVEAGARLRRESDRAARCTWWIKAWIPGRFWRANRARFTGRHRPTLHARIQEVERVLYPATVGALARARCRCEGRLSGMGGVMLEKCGFAPVLMAKDSGLAASGLS